MIFITRHVEIQGSDQTILVVVGACKTLLENDDSKGNVQTVRGGLLGVSSCSACCLLNSTRSSRVWILESSILARYSSSRVLKVDSARPLTRCRGIWKNIHTERIEDILFAAFSRLFNGYQGNRLHNFDKALELFIRSLPFSQLKQLVSFGHVFVG